MSENPELRGVLSRIAALETESKALLATHEAATSRIVTLEQSYVKLTDLSLDQDELFRESLRAVENGLFRAAHVLAWAGFIDWLHNHLVDDHLSAITAAQPNWTIKSAEDFREYSDFQVIETGKKAKVYNNTMMRTLHGLLSRRNECAHPSPYFPDLNRTLGYVSDLVERIERLQ